jgi:hypothetical protein
MELGEGELADRFQHRKAWLVISLVGLTDEVLVEQ